MNTVIAIGAAIASINRYWSRYRTWNRNIKGSRSSSKTAGSRQ